MGRVFYIKNMVCPRCIRVVREDLEKLGLTVARVDLGEVEIADDISADVENMMREVLQRSGFDVLEDQKRKTVEKIKLAIIDLIYNTEEGAPRRLTISSYLSNRLGLDYNYMSSLFSSVENITIEKYVILQKIERVKELLKYEELTVSEIAYRLHYSSTQHLSNQFKQITGLSPTQFRKMVENTRKPIDQVV